MSKIPAGGNAICGVEREMLIFPCVFIIGGLIYGLLELIWRGWTHWTMLICGGICFAIMYAIGATRLAAPKKLILSAGAITAVEFITGCLVNLKWGMNVWDYSSCKFNLLGQICPSFTMLWLGLSAPGLALCRVLRGLLRGNQ